MDKRFPWKRICIGLAAITVCCMLIAEFGVVFWFFAVIFGLSALWVFGKAWWDARRSRKEQDGIEAAREENRRKEAGRRREACRETRYSQEERGRIVAHIEGALGPAGTWDLEEGAEVLRLDAALVPPTAALPYWKAATVGAGAYTMEGGEDASVPLRAELAMALPPDWDPADRWPVRVLRDAVRRFLVADGFVGRGSVYRGFSLISAGFAGAVATDGFPGLPDLGAAAVPGAPGVYFFWLVPLLKPELDYLQRRGLFNLARRFPAERPWADGAREPLAAPGTWFDEDIAPFTWSEDGGLYCLGMEIGEWRQELFLRAGYSNLAWGWEDLARRYLRRYQPDDEPFVDFACEERVFFAASRDEEIMRKLALGLSGLLRDRPEEVRQML